MAQAGHTSQSSCLGVSSRLSKPFKSPLRQRTENSAKGHDPTATAEAEKTKDTHDGNNNKRILPPSSSARQIVNIPATTPSDEFTPPPNKKHKPQSDVNSSSSSPLRKRSSITADPEISELQKKQRSLQSRLLALRSELDTASQALKIESSNKDAELEALIVKWRGVSQDAADEVFQGARERVARMGGVAGWKKAQNEQNQRARESYEDDLLGDDKRDIETRKAEMMEQYDVDVDAVDEQDEDGIGINDEEEVRVRFIQCRIYHTGR